MCSLWKGRILELLSITLPAEFWAHLPAHSCTLVFTRKKFVARLIARNPAALRLTLSTTLAVLTGIVATHLKQRVYYFILKMWFIAFFLLTEHFSFTLWPHRIASFALCPQTNVFFWLQEELWLLHFDQKLQSKEMLGKYIESRKFLKFSWVFLIL